MEAERERESMNADLDPEDEAARLVEAEDKLREALDDSRDDDLAVANTRIVLSPAPLITGGRRQVIGGGRDGDEFVFRVDDGDVVEIGVPWPDDPHDPREPLVRLAKANGVAVDRIADIDSVPVVKSDEGEMGIIVPPAQRYRDIEVVLPGNRTFTTRIPRPFDLATRAAMRVGSVLARTRFVPVQPSKLRSVKRWDVNGNLIAGASIPVGLTGMFATVILGEMDDSLGLTVGVATLFLVLVMFLFGVLLETELDVF